MPVNRFDRTAYGDGPPPDPAMDEELEPRGPEALRHLQAQLEELADYARLYAAAKKDAVLAVVRKSVLWAAAGIAAFAILCTMLVTATVLGMIGVAQVIGVGLGDRIWAGYLITGFGLLAIAGLGLFATVRIVQRRLRAQTVKKYASRHQNQRSRHGRDARQTGTQAERN